MCWLFPGKTAHIDSFCLCRGEPIAIDVKDGELLSAEPAKIVGYADSELGTPGDFSYK